MEFHYRNGELHVTHIHPLDEAEATLDRMEVIVWELSEVPIWRVVKRNILKSRLIELSKHLRKNIQKAKRINS